MHKRKHWIVAAGLAVCGLLLAAFPWDTPGMFQAEKTVYRPPREKKP